MPESIFVSRGGFYEFFSLHEEEKKQNGYVEESKEKKQREFIYKMILQRFYNYTSISGHEILYAYKNPTTHLTTYYNISPDTQFIDIHFDGELPELNLELVSSKMQEGEGIELLQELLPLEKFKFDGFSVITLTDVTLQHAIDGLSLIHI